MNAHVCFAPTLSRLTRILRLPVVLAALFSSAFAQSLIIHEPAFIGFTSSANVGQSFTLESGFNYSITGFNWIGATPSGVVRLFDQEYTGTPNDLPSTTVGLLATSNTYASGQFTFSTPVEVSGGTTLYIYGTGYQVTYDPFNGYAGGTAFTASGPTGNYTVQFGDARFEVFGTASAIPEPSTYAAIAGMLGLGLALWRRRMSVC